VLVEANFEPIVEPGKPLGTQLDGHILSGGQRLSAHATTPA
jgi:hypothetical protein